MIDEFIRYRIPQFRELSGWFQILGSLGIIIGFWIDNIQVLSTIGLSLMMLFGVGVRIKIKDDLIKILPAVCYFVLNTYLSCKLISEMY